MVSLDRWLHPRRLWLDIDRYVDEMSGTLLRYHEGGRSVVAGYEDLGNREIAVFPGEISPWEPPREGEAAHDEISFAVSATEWNEGSATLKMSEPELILGGGAIRVFGDVAERLPSRGDWNDPTHWKGNYADAGIPVPGEVIAESFLGDQYVIVDSLVVR